MSIWRTLWIFIFVGRPNRVHNADIRVVILKSIYHDSFFITSHKTTHFRNTWYSYHLHLIISAVVAVTRKESTSIRIDLIRKTEEDALYSKAPEEYTLILSHGGILLSMELRKTSMRAD
jgi:hypothetical protein